MKDFNLDNLPKKTPYKIPQNIFEDMQKNVIKATIEKKINHPKIFKINFSTVTSLAATLAVIFGVTFLWKTNQTDITKPMSNNNSIAQNTIAKSETTHKNVIQNNNYTSETIKNITKIESELAQPKKNIIITKQEFSKTPDENYEQLLNSLTDEELKELAENTDHDIYLELYN